MPRLSLRPLVVATLLAGGALLAPPASADLPPPPGIRHVDFQIRVEGLAAFPDMVLIAYPHSLSNGAPTTEHALLRDGEPLSVGRRSATPKLWAVKRADYDAFASSYKPTRSFEDAPLDAFFKSGKARECRATIEPVHELPIADPRAAATQSFHADAVDATQCKLTAAAPPHPAPTDTGERAEPVAPPPDAPQEGNAAPPKASGGGCAGCATASADEIDGSKHLLAAAFLALGAAVALRRRR